LQIAEACVDIVMLATELAGQATPELEPDARSAAALAAGATRAAALLVEVNLSVRPDDGRVRLARRLSEQAEAAVRA
jgi:formiminotetrahydrofolate cyclodeaminase